jgi:hypothetical protein
MTEYNVEIKKPPIQGRQEPYYFDVSVTADNYIPSDIPQEAQILVRKVDTKYHARMNFVDSRAIINPNDARRSERVLTTRSATDTSQVILTALSESLSGKTKTLNILPNALVSVYIKNNKFMSIPEHQILNDQKADAEGNVHFSLINLNRPADLAFRVVIDHPQIGGRQELAEKYFLYVRNPAPNVPEVVKIRVDQNKMAQVFIKVVDSRLGTPLDRMPVGVEFDKVRRGGLFRRALLSAAQGVTENDGIAVVKVGPLPENVRTIGFTAVAQPGPEDFLTHSQAVKGAIVNPNYNASADLFVDLPNGGFQQVSHAQKGEDRVFKLETHTAQDFAFAFPVSLSNKLGTDNNKVGVGVTALVKIDGKEHATGTITDERGFGFVFPRSNVAGEHTIEIILEHEDIGEVALTPYTVRFTSPPLRVEILQPNFVIDKNDRKGIEFRVTDVGNVPVENASVVLHFTQDDPLTGAIREIATIRSKYITNNNGLTEVVVYGEESDPLSKSSTFNGFRPDTNPYEYTVTAHKEGYAEIPDEQRLGGAGTEGSLLVKEDENVCVDLHVLKVDGRTLERELRHDLRIDKIDRTHERELTSGPYVIRAFAYTEKGGVSRPDPAINFPITILVTDEAGGTASGEGFTDQNGHFFFRLKPPLGGHPGEIKVDITIDSKYENRALDQEPFWVLTKKPITKTVLEVDDNSLLGYGFKHVVRARLVEEATRAPVADCKYSMSLQGTPLVPVTLGQEGWAHFELNNVPFGSRVATIIAEPSEKFERQERNVTIQLFSDSMLVDLEASYFRAGKQRTVKVLQGKRSKSGFLLHEGQDQQVQFAFKAVDDAQAYPLPAQVRVILGYNEGGEVKYRIVSTDPVQVAENGVLDFSFTGAQLTSNVTAVAFQVFHPLVNKGTKDPAQFRIPVAMLRQAPRVLVEDVRFTQGKDVNLNIKVLDESDNGIKGARVGIRIPSLLKKARFGTVKGKRGVSMDLSSFTPGDYNVIIDVDCERQGYQNPEQRSVNVVVDAAKDIAFDIVLEVDDKEYHSQDVHNQVVEVPSTAKNYRFIAKGGRPGERLQILEDAEIEMIIDDEAVRNSMPITSNEKGVISGTFTNVVPGIASSVQVKVNNHSLVGERSEVFEFSFKGSLAVTLSNPSIKVDQGDQAKVELQVTDAQDDTRDMSDCAVDVYLYPQGEEEKNFYQAIYEEGKFVLDTFNLNTGVSYNFRAVAHKTGYADATSEIGEIIVREKSPVYAKLSGIPDKLYKGENTLPLVVTLSDINNQPVATGDLVVSILDDTDQEIVTESGSAFSGTLSLPVTAKFAEAGSYKLVVTASNFPSTQNILYSEQAGRKEYDLTVLDVSYGVELVLINSKDPKESFGRVRTHGPTQTLQRVEEDVFSWVGVRPYVVYQGQKQPVVLVKDVSINVIRRSPSNTKEFSIKSGEIILIEDDVGETVLDITLGISGEEVHLSPFKVVTTEMDKTATEVVLEHFPTDPVYTTTSIDFAVSVNELGKPNQKVPSGEMIVSLNGEKMDQATIDSVASYTLSLGTLEEGEHIFSFETTGLPKKFSGSSTQITLTVVAPKIPTQISISPLPTIFKDVPFAFNVFVSDGTNYLDDGTITAEIFDKDDKSIFSSQGNVYSNGSLIKVEGIDTLGEYTLRVSAAKLGDKYNDPEVFEQTFRVQRDGPVPTSFEFVQEPQEEINEGDAISFALRVVDVDENSDVRLVDSQVKVRVKGLPSGGVITPTSTASADNQYVFIIPTQAGVGVTSYELTFLAESSHRGFSNPESVTKMIRVVAAKVDSQERSSLGGAGLGGAGLGGATKKQVSVSFNNGQGLPTEIVSYKPFEIVAHVTDSETNKNVISGNFNLQVVDNNNTVVWQGIQPLMGQYDSFDQDNYSGDLLGQRSGFAEFSVSNLEPGSYTFRYNVQDLAEEFASVNGQEPLEVTGKKRKKVSVSFNNGQGLPTEVFALTPTKVQAVLVDAETNERVKRGLMTLQVVSHSPQQVVNEQKVPLNSKNPVTIDIPQLEVGTYSIMYVVGSLPKGFMDLEVQEHHLEVKKSEEVLIAKVTAVGGRRHDPTKPLSFFQGESKNIEIKVFYRKDKKVNFASFDKDLDLTFVLEGERGRVGSLQPPSQILPAQGVAHTVYTAPYKLNTVRLVVLATLQGEQGFVDRNIGSFNIEVKNIDRQESERRVQATMDLRREESQKQKDGHDTMKALRKEQERYDAEAKRQRLAQEEAERQRLAQEEAERQKLAEEAERQKLAEEAERQKLAEEAERQRLAQEESRSRDTPRLAPSERRAIIPQLKDAASVIEKYQSPQTLFTEVRVTKSPAAILAGNFDLDSFMGKEIEKLIMLAAEYINLINGMVQGGLVRGNLMRALGDKAEEIERNMAWTERTMKNIDAIKAQVITFLEQFKPKVGWFGLSKTEDQAVKEAKKRISILDNFDIQTFINSSDYLDVLYTNQLYLEQKFGIRLSSFAEAASQYAQASQALFNSVQSARYPFLEEARSRMRDDLVAYGKEEEYETCRQVYEDTIAQLEPIQLALGDFIDDRDRRVPRDDIRYREPNYVHNLNELMRVVNIGRAPEVEQIRSFIRDSSSELRRRRRTLNENTFVNLYRDDIQKLQTQAGFFRNVEENLLYNNDVKACFDNDRNLDAIRGTMHATMQSLNRSPLEEPPEYNINPITESVLSSFNEHQGDERTRDQLININAKLSDEEQEINRIIRKANQILEIIREENTFVVEAREQIQQMREALRQKLEGF